MHAYMNSAVLTPDSVRTAFQSSGKTHLFITGGRKTGKTTLLKTLFPSPMRGITTWAVPAEQVLMRENGTEKTAQIGKYDSTLGGRENKMRMCAEGFLQVGIPALQSCMITDDEWITIDEIGYLETSCPEYRDIVLALLEKKRAAAVIRKQDLPFLQALCSRDDVFLVDLDAPFGNMGCVIMASGLGKRFGGNKLMADFGGYPMIERALRATDGIFARRVVVTRSEEVAQYCESRGTEVILHTLPGRNDTVRLGIQMMEGTDGCLFCQGDQPLLSRETVASIVLAAKNVPGAICRPICGDEAGAPMLFPKDLYDALRQLPEGKGGGYIAKQHPEQGLTIRIQDPYELMDVDTQEDLARLHAHERDYRTVSD